MDGQHMLDLPRRLGQRMPPSFLTKGHPRSRMNVRRVPLLGKAIDRFLDLRQLANEIVGCTTCRHALGRR